MKIDKQDKHNCLLNGEVGPARGPARTPEAGAAAPAGDGQVGAPRTGTLRTLFGLYRWRLLFTYALFNLENLLRLSYPLVLGRAINDLLRPSYAGLALFAAVHLSHLLIGAARRVYDTRTFTRIYTDLATRLVLEQRGRAVEVSRVAARSSLSRAFVDFFERDVPNVVRALYSVVGALVMLCLYDWLLPPLCLALLVPAYLLNRVFARKSLSCNGRINDQLEQEVGVIGEGEAGQVRAHYGALARWRTRLSDWATLNFGLMELCVLGLMAAALVRVCGTPGAAAGDIFAMFRYVLLFTLGLDSIPLLVLQVSRLRDIGGRMGHGPAAAAPPAGGVTAAGP